MNRCKLLFSILMLFVLAGCATQYSDNEKAYALYQKGVDSFESGQIYSAQDYFNEAKAYVSSDTYLKIGTKSEYSGMTCVKRCTFTRNVSGNHVEYNPNYYLNEIKNEIYEQEKRKELAGKMENAPKLKVLMRLDDTDGDRTLNADEKGVLTVLVTNTGKSDAEQLTLKAKSSSSTVVFSDSTQVIPVLLVGQSKRLTYRVTNSLLSQSRKATIALYAEEKDGILEGDIKSSLSIRTSKYRAPKLTLKQKPSAKTVVAGDSTWQVFQLCNGSSYPALNLRLSLTKLDVESAYSNIEQRDIHVIPAKECREVVAHFKPEVSLKQGYRMRTALVVNDSKTEVAHLRLGTRVDYSAMSDVEFIQVK
ncbi:hypothetical protein VIN01S_22640 [Vibrio inusitatus NBRC 102082]|uniref:Lipoprotein n=1 Tax=Vibrio inusitatus NBRC 102082 TaxID=1219070 RepID=A0A4Y3HXM1_9VIBR|nr:hypothetical protein [Vibrio inusitatus]GEA51460.1 hypothetical protein VIN01S_22640 [Vibrio inusitatus NBRC 102082]